MYTGLTFGDCMSLTNSETIALARCQLEIYLWYTGNKIIKEA